MNIIKADGSIENFSEEKVLSSIKRAGVSQSLQFHVLENVRSKLYNNIPSSEIFNLIMESLDRSTQPIAKSKYSLKQAIMQIGPTGYPFEDFIAQVLKEQAYETSTRQVLLGKCVQHEVDVIAIKDGQKNMIEAKYHNNPGAKTDVQVSLYVKSRFDDLKEKHSLTQAWVVTNTKATSDAIAFALCSGMKIISWSYPEGEGLRDLIERTNMHPITMLTSLSQSQKEELLNRHIVLCKELRTNPDLLSLLHLKTDQREKVIAELHYIHNS